MVVLGYQLCIYLDEDIKEVGTGLPGSWFDHGTTSESRLLVLMDQTLHNLSSGTKEVLLRF